MDFGRFFIIILLIKWTESQLCLICTKQNICEICDNPKCDQLSLYVVKAIPARGYEVKSSFEKLRRSTQVVIYATSMSFFPLDRTALRN